MYTLIYSGITKQQSAASGAAVIIDKMWSNKIDSYTYVNDKILIVIIKY